MRHIYGTISGLVIGEDLLCVELLPPAFSQLLTYVCFDFYASTPLGLGLVKGRCLH